MVASSSLAHRAMNVSLSNHPFTMSIKTITLDADAYTRLNRQRLPRESFSQAVRRLVQENCPALTAAELVDALKPFEGVGAGRKRRRRAAA